MSWDCVKQMMTVSDGLTYQDKWVLIALADYKNVNEGVCYPRISQIAAKTLMSESTVKRCLRHLIDGGFIDITRRHDGHKALSSWYYRGVKLTYLRGSGWHLKEGQVDPLYKEEPVKEPVKEPVNCGEPQEDDLKPTKLAEVISKSKKTKSDIFNKFKPTPKGCGDLWRDCRASSAPDNGFGAELLNKEFSMLNKARKRVSGDFTEIVWNCMGDWVGFTKHAEAQGGAFNCPLTPTVSFFVKFVEHAATFKAAPAEDFGVKLTAKPLTKPITKPHTPSKAASIEDVQAIAEKYGL